MSYLLRCSPHFIFHDAQLCFLGGDANFSFVCLFNQFSGENTLTSFDSTSCYVALYLVSFVLVHSHLRSFVLTNATHVRQRLRFPPKILFQTRSVETSSFYGEIRNEITLHDFHNGEFRLLYCSRIYGRNDRSHPNSTVRISNLAKYELKVIKGCRVIAI